MLARDMFELDASWRLVAFTSCVVLGALWPASICLKMRRFYSVVVITSGSDFGTPGNGGSTPPKTFTFALLPDLLTKMTVVVGCGTSCRGVALRF